MKWPKNKPNMRNFVINDSTTARTVKTNLHVIIPPSNPWPLRIEKGPFCRNFVIPKEQVIIEIIYVVLNQRLPLRPPNTAHLLLSGWASQYSGAGDRESRYSGHSLYSGFSLQNFLKLILG